jgi:hypothetical protein
MVIRARDMKITNDLSSFRVNDVEFVGLRRSDQEILSFCPRSIRERESCRYEQNEP